VLTASTLFFDILLPQKFFPERPFLGIFNLFFVPNQTLDTGNLLKDRDDKPGRMNAALL
jgi:hypothetical protein